MGNEKKGNKDKVQMLRRVIKTNMKRKKRKEKKREKVPERSFVHKVTMRNEKKLRKDGITVG